MYCPNCGKLIDDTAIFCSECGRRLKAETSVSTKGRSLVAAGLLGLFLGVFGAHNFYLGYRKKAAIQLAVTALSIIIWVAFFFSFASFLFSYYYRYDMHIMRWFFVLALTALAQFGIWIWTFIEAILIFCSCIPNARGEKLL